MESTIPNDKNEAKFRLVIIVISVISMRKLFQMAEEGMLRTHKWLYENEDKRTKVYGLLYENVHKDDLTVPQLVDIPNKYTVTIIDVEGSSFPNVSINRNSDKSKGNRDMTHSNNYVHTASMKKCFHSRGHRIVIGSENIGKTSWCKFILGFKCIVTETFNDIRKFDHKRHNGIIFENLDFKDTHYMLIESLVCYEDRIFRFKDVEVLIPATTRLIFTSRKDDGMIFGTQKCSRKYYKECFRLRLKTNTYREEESDSESPITFEED